MNKAIINLPKKYSPKAGVYKTSFKLGSHWTHTHNSYWNGRGGTANFNDGKGRKCNICNEWTLHGMKRIVSKLTCVDCYKLIKRQNLMKKLAKEIKC